MSWLDTNLTLEEVLERATPKEIHEMVEAVMDELVPLSGTERDPQSEVNAAVTTVFMRGALEYYLLTMKQNNSRSTSQGSP